MHKDIKGEVLIALLKEKSDFAILQEQGWYRVPVKKAPKRWPPRWLAFYQPNVLVMMVTVFATTAKSVRSER